MIKSNINTGKLKIQAVYGNEVVLEKEIYILEFETAYSIISNKLQKNNSSYYLPGRSDCEFISSEGTKVTKEGRRFEAEATYTVKLLKKPQIEEPKEQEAKQEEEITEEEKITEEEEILEEEEKEVDQDSHVSLQASSSQGMIIMHSSFEMPPANEIGRMSPFLNPGENIPPSTPILPSIVNSTEKLSETKETHK
jgi:hypothetical protein